MKIVILALFAFWWLALIRSFVAHGGDVFGEWPISNQITGKLSEPFDAAFIGLAAALMLSPFAFDARAWWIVAIAAVAAFSSVAVMVTRKYLINERAHITFAGLAFGGAAALFAAIAWVHGETLLFVVACATMAPAIIEIALHIEPLHKWLGKFSRVEWLTAILVSASAVLAVIFE